MKWESIVANMIPDSYKCALGLFDTVGENRQDWYMPWALGWHCAQTAVVSFEFKKTARKARRSTKYFRRWEGKIVGMQKPLWLTRCYTYPNIQMINDVELTIIAAGSQIRLEIRYLFVLTDWWNLIFYKVARHYILKAERRTIVLRNTMVVEFRLRKIDIAPQADEWRANTQRGSPYTINYI